MRTFVALDLAPQIKGSLTDLITSLSQEEADVKWVKQQGMHITLKYLGEVPESKIPQITHSIRKACGSRVSFQLSFKGTGFFPSQSKFPRVLWAGIAENHDLANLHKSVEAELAKLGFSSEKKRFHPHLTLGRVKSRKNIASVIEKLNDYRETNFGNMQVKTVTFFKSTLRPSGAEYDVLSGIQLR